MYDTVFPIFRSIPFFTSFATSRGYHSWKSVGGKVYIESMREYRRVVIGATFDHIHKGHEALLVKAFTVGDHVVIGLTTDVYLDRFKPGVNVKDYEERKNNVLLWLRDNGYAGRATIVPIDDPWGPLVNGEPTMEAIVVSKETRDRAEELNHMREKNGLPGLSIIEIPVIINRKEDVHISSTNIRAGLMNEKGDLFLPLKFRTRMREPLGSILKESEVHDVIDGDRDKFLIAIGDRTTQTILSEEITLKFAAIDMQVERKRVTWEKMMYDQLIHDATVHTLVSGPGYVSHEASRLIRQWSIDGFPKTVLVIDGEEDLLVLPVLTQAPLDSILYYGQPGKGLVRAVVDTKLKEKAEDLLTHFER